MFDLSDRVILVTGAAGMLGGHVVQAFLACGSTLVLTDRNPEKLRAAHAEKASARVMVRDCRLDDGPGLTRLVEEVRSRFHHIDGLVNLVGAYRVGDPVHRTDPAIWQTMLEANLFSVVATARAVVPAMIELGSGCIVNVGSPSGLRAGEDDAAYAVSKAGVLRVTESMAAELGPRGIRVNCVLPATLVADGSLGRPEPGATPQVEASAVAETIVLLTTPWARAIHGALVPLVGYPPLA